MPYKRKRSLSVSSRKSYPKRAKSAAVRGRTGYAGVLRASVRRASAGVKRLTSMIETKEGSRRATPGVNMPHNNIYVVTDNTTAAALNIFNLSQGIADGQQLNGGNRVGDQISLRGVSIKFMVENSLGRSRVNFRVMLLRVPRGFVIGRTTIFKQDSANMMIDVVNTKSVSVVWQKSFTVTAASAAASSVQLVTGAPVELLPGGTQFGGQGSRIVKAWIPGSKFGRNGNIQYENGSATEVKFYDYRIVFAVYDWYGTPQDVNNVGLLNELNTKIYFKDA